jgi:hypothetical protein
MALARWKLMDSASRLWQLRIVPSSATECPTTIWLMVALHQSFATSFN